MVEIKPFPGIVYNFNKIKRPHKVICPPYDIITPAQARVYRRLSPYNMTHLTLPKPTLGKNKYKVAHDLFQDWIKQEIFKQDDKPAIYFYQQEYKINKIRLKRVGFIACLGLKDSSSIHGHEHTYIEPKEDRFKLLVNVQSNLEPIFVMFQDSNRFIRNILNRYVRSNRPLIRFRDKDNNINTFWRLTQPNILKRINTRISKKIIFIADGHHRYEVSLNYKNLMRRKLSTSTCAARDFNYIMAYFCPIESPGLVIRPVHRLVKGIKEAPLDKFKRIFYIRKINQRKLLDFIQSKDQQRRIIGAYINGQFYLLILKDKLILNKIDKDYRSLDISLLNLLVLKRLLRVNPKDKNRIIFNASPQELIRQAKIYRNSLVFFIQSAKISDIICLAKKDKKMPAKTTYFYPKVPSGLVVYKFRPIK